MPFTVMVAVNHAISYSNLLPLAIKAAQANDGQIVLANLVVVPDQLPLYDGERFATKNQSLVADTLAAVEAMDIPVTSVTLVTHRTVQAVAEAVLERRVNLLLVSSHQRSVNVQPDIGTCLHQLLAKVNCDVLFITDNGKPPFRKLLVPIAVPEQTRASLDVALLLTDAERTLIEVFHVFPRGNDLSRRQAVAADIRDRIDSFRNSVKGNHPAIRFKGIEDKAPFESILREVKDFDCVLVGIGQKGWLKRKFRRNRLFRLIKELDCTLAAVRTGTTARSDHAEKSQKDLQQ